MGEGVDFNMLVPVTTAPKLPSTISTESFGWLCSVDHIDRTYTFARLEDWKE